MAKRESGNRLDRGEIALVKAMIAEGRYNDQEILAHFTRPMRTINHARISDIREGRKHATVAVASPEELAQFLRTWPQIDPQTGLHIAGDELVIKAREAMLNAVQSYNNPRAFFKAEVFITLAVIAWTYLLHHHYRRNGIDHRIKKIVDGNEVVLKTRHGADKHWTLEDCLGCNQCPLDAATVANLQFLIGIRHEIEHQMTRRIDDTIGAKLQACCLNFNRALKDLVAERHGLEGDLSFALQFATIEREQRDQLLKQPDLPPNIQAMTLAFETGLPDEVAADLRYAYRVYLVERTANSKGKADQVIEFVKGNSAEGREVRRILLKEAEKAKYKPKQIVDRMKAEGFPRFREHEHTQLWKTLDAKRPGTGFGVYLKDGDWWWYEAWIDRVRAHCEENRVKYA
ncbi:DUF3644 domain-containing protein [Azospirillum sp. B2RO_4]|uniref:DUF3644 domain-containing protein n=1 Tax=Azospirillum sp. B2RO_4 TaxID=3027796 RepID=UPI003DA8CF92